MDRRTDGGRIANTFKVSPKMFGGADVGAFSQDDFDVYQWINKVEFSFYFTARLFSPLHASTVYSAFLCSQVLEDKPTEASLDAHISAVSMKLQVARREYAWEYYRKQSISYFKRGDCSRECSRGSLRRA